MNRKQIRILVGDGIYQKGKEIWESDGVYEYDVEPHEYQDGIDIIYGVVRGSGVKTYHVMLMYDFFKGQLVESTCDCPVFSHSDELCPHCVAVLLEYNMEFSDEDDEDEEEYQYTLEDYQNGRRGKKDKEKKTSPVITALLNKQVMKKMLPLSNRTSYGKVRIVPKLECFHERFSLSFSLGIEKLYVLKDVLDFAEKMNSCENYTYGKQLSFVHIMESFEPDSKPIVSFILRWVSNNQEKYSYPSYYGYNYYTPKVRDMDLSAEELEDFLLSMGQKKFAASIPGAIEEIWHVEENVRKHLTLKGDEQGATITVEIPPVYVGHRYIISFEKGMIYLESKEKLAQIQDFITDMGRVPDHTAYINNKDLPVFCRELLPQLKNIYEIVYDNFDEKNYVAQSAAFEIYLDAPQKEMITCSLKAVYGENKFDVFGENYRSVAAENERSAGRDIFQEGSVGAAVAEWFNAYDDEKRQMVLANDEERMYRLLTEGIPALQLLGTVFVSEALKRFQIVEAPKVKVGISVSEDMLNLSLSSSEFPLDELAEILSKYERKKKFFRLKNGEFVNLENSGIAELAQMTKDLGLTDAQLRREKIALPGYRLFYLEDEVGEGKGYEVARDSYYKKLVEDTGRVMEQNFNIPPALDEIARDYQKLGFNWIVKITRSGFGGILADDMGLGKTLQVISALQYEYDHAKESENRRCLIITPASLVYNWESEFERFAPDLPVVPVAGSMKQRKEQIQNAGERDILITSYDLLKRDIENYENLSFYMEIIDEAQFIKNHTTQAAKAVKAVAAKCHLALTGTPIENRLSELWSIFDYLMPGFLYSYERFRREIEAPAVTEDSKEAFERLRKMVRPFILRRLKEDVLKDLPEKIEEVYYAKLSGEQQKLYDAHVQRLRIMLDKQSDEEFKSSKIQILAELTRLRQLCCDPGLLYEGYKENSAKSEMCMELIVNAIEGGHKILLFSQFTSMLERLEEQLKERGISFYTITGATPKEQRISLVKAFNNGDVPVFCISLKAGGTGLNLASADIVIHFDPWWNLAVQNQATDRAHRIGQKNIVTVYKLIARGTIEEKVLKLQERKKELADRLLSGDDLASGSFTRDELMELLG